MKRHPAADKLYIAHMLECMQRIHEYTKSDGSAFRSSRLIQDGVIRNLQLMAESSQRLSDELKASEPSIPWRAISGFRNVLVHDYLSIDIDAVWLVVERELPPLETALQRIMDRLGAA